MRLSNPKRRTSQAMKAIMPITSTMINHNHV